MSSCCRCTMLYVAVPSTTADSDACESHRRRSEGQCFPPSSSRGVTWTGISRAPPPKGFFEHSQISARPVAARVSQCDERSLRRVLPASTADVGGRRPDARRRGQRVAFETFSAESPICSLTFLGALKPVFVLALPLLPVGVDSRIQYRRTIPERRPPGGNLIR